MKPPVGFSRCRHTFRGGQTRDQKTTRGHRPTFRHQVPRYTRRITVFSSHRMNTTKQVSVLFHKPSALIVFINFHVLFVGFPPKPTSLTLALGPHLSITRTQQPPLPPSNNNPRCHHHHPLHLRPNLFPLHPPFRSARCCCSNCPKEAQLHCVISTVFQVTLAIWLKVKLRFNPFII